jgi:uncharacterized protein (TIGR02246 family)
MNHYVRLLVLCAAALFPSFAYAQAKTPDVKAALSEWVQRVETGTVDDIVSLYDKDSVMLSAFAVAPMTSHDQLRGYYKKVVMEPNRKVDVTTQDVRQFGNVATNTGLYVFHFEQDGEPVDVPARFTFVYVLKDGKWSIISHHSSRVPGTKMQ